MILVNAPKLYRFFKGAYKKLGLVLCLGVTAISLGACDADLFSGGESSQTYSNSSGENAGKATVSSDGVSFPGQQAALKIPPPLNAPSANTPGNLSALQPARGINAQRLFTAPLKDENERFVRVETAVQDIRDEINGFAPAITRLVAVEKDIQDLVEQLDVLLQNEPAPTPVAAAPATSLVPAIPELPAQNVQARPTPAPTPAPRAPAKTAPKPVVKSGGSGLNNIRICLLYTSPSPRD